MERISNDSSGFNCRSDKNSLYIKHISCPFIFLLVVLIISCFTLNLVKEEENEDFENDVFVALISLTIINITLCTLGLALSIILFCIWLRDYKKDRFFIYGYICLLLICFLVSVINFTEVTITWNMKQEQNDKIISLLSKNEINLNHHDHNNKNYSYRNYDTKENKKHLPSKIQKNSYSETKNSGNLNKKTNFSLQKTNYSNKKKEDTSNFKNDTKNKEKLQKIKIFHEGLEFEMKILFFFSFLALVNFSFVSCHSALNR